MLEIQGRLYQNLCATTYDIPIGIYRTESMPRKEEVKEHNRVSEIKVNFN